MQPAAEQCEAPCPPEITAWIRKVLIFKDADWFMRLKLNLIKSQVCLPKEQLPRKDQRAFKHTITVLETECQWHNSLLQDAAQHTEMLRLRVVAEGKRDRDTPSLGDCMGGKLKK